VIKQAGSIFFACTVFRSISKVISLAMTRQDIADYLGLTIETVSRTLSQLERNAFIEVATRMIRLKDPTTLRNLNC
jgi:CRP/FNR family nitrogen fixation transcriptional regulator